MDHEVALLSKDATYVLVYCLTEQGKSGSKPFKLNIHLAALIIKMKGVDFSKALQELQIAGFIELRVESATIGNQLPTNGNQTPTNGCLEREKERVDPVADRNQDPTEVLILKFSKIHADEGWVRLEHRKALAWYTERGKKFTERAFGNWLRRGLDTKPITPKAPPNSGPGLIWNSDLQQYIECPDVDH